MRMILLAISLLAAAGCATMKQMSQTTRFDAAEVGFFKDRGTNSIRGSALMRQQGGGVVTCAGQKVWLLPAGAYAKERITLLYGNSGGGYNRAFMGNQIDSIDPTYQVTQKEAVCDAQGFFSFKDLADGEYYLTTLITWYAGSNYVPEGGSLAKLVALSGGEAEEVVLSP